jgi:hypothetical protein
MKRLLFVWVLCVCLGSGTVSAEEWHFTFVGQGGDPKWSPSGQRLAVWQADTIHIYNIDSLKLVTTLIVKHPWHYFWINEDTLAFYYKQQTPPKVPSIIINGVFDLRGNYTEVSRAANYPHDYVSPWQKLADGSIGVSEVKNDSLQRFMRLIDGKLQTVAVDSSTLMRCRSRFGSLRSRYDYFPSPAGDKAFAYRVPDEMTVLLDSAGQEILTIGPRVVKNQRERFDYIGDPQWSACGRYVTYEHTEEDGHFLYSSSICIVDTETKTIQVVTNLVEGEVGEVYWSPIAPKFVIVSAKLGGVVLWHK